MGTLSQDKNSVDRKVIDLVGKCVVLLDGYDVPVRLPFKYLFMTLDYCYCLPWSEVTAVKDPENSDHYNGMAANASHYVGKN